MKKYLFILVAILAIVACNKTKSDDSFLLEGNWRMISVQDKNTLAQTTNPGNLGDVIITFAVGKISGKTPSNDIWPSNYTTGPGNKLSVQDIGGTKVGENAWGNLFYTNMATIEKFSFSTNNMLSIGTKEKILKFERL